MRLAIVWAAMVSSLWGGSARGDNSDFLIKTWQDHEGISEASVLAVAQSSDGYLWVGSDVGLLRFNGVTVTRAEQFCDLVRLTEAVASLHTDRSGRVWAGAEHGLAVYDRGVWRRVNGTNFSVRSVAEDVNGRFLLGGEEGQLRTVKDYNLADFQSPEGLTSSGVFCITDSHDGNFWLANRGFIGRWTSKGWLRVGPPGLIPTPLIAAPAKAGGVWVYTPSQLRRYQADGTVTTYSAPSLDQARELMEDHSGTIWIASTVRGLTHFRPGGEVFYITATNGLTHTSARCLMEDTEGNIWAGGTLSGLTRLKPRRFLSIGRDEGLPDNAVRTIAEVAPGQLVVGTHGSSLAQIQEGKVIWKDSSSTDARSQYVWSLLHDRAGRLWIGTFNGGLFVQENGVKRPFPLPPPLEQTITCLMEDVHGRIWLGTPTGLGVIENNTLVTCLTNAAIAGCAITALAEDVRSGTLWIGTFSHGVFQMDEADRTHLVQLTGLPAQRISSLTLDTDGYLWVGVFEHGLASVHNGSMTLIRTPQGLPADTIGSMLEDDRGAFWLGSTRASSGFRAMNCTALRNNWLPGRSSISSMSATDSVPSIARRVISPRHYGITPAIFGSRPTGASSWWIPRNCASTPTHPRSWSSGSGSSNGPAPTMSTLNPSLTIW